MNTKLLIADSDHELCDLHRRFFTHLGYEVEVAHDGLECLGKMITRRPNVLILELELPWGSGEGVLECMLRDEKLRRIPVILVSDRLAPTTMSDDAVTLVAHALPKPCRLKDLLDRIALCTEWKSGEQPCTVGVCP